MSVRTAEHYKAGRRRPSKRVLKLFRLHRDKKILGAEWHGHSVAKDRIYGPNGDFIRPSDIVMWALIWHVLSEKDPRMYRELLERA